MINRILTTIITKQYLLKAAHLFLYALIGWKTTMLVKCYSKFDLSIYRIFRFISLPFLCYLIFIIRISCISNVKGIQSFKFLILCLGFLLKIKTKPSAMTRATLISLIALVLVFNSQAQVFQTDNDDQLIWQLQKDQTPWIKNLKAKESAKSRTDIFGDPPSLKWAKQFGGDGLDVTYDITEDSQNNTYSIGSISGTISIGGSDYTSQGFMDMFILKTSGTGEVIWFKTFSPQAGEFMRGTSIKHKNGSLVLSGFIEGSTDFGTGGTVISSDSDLISFFGEIDEDGDFIWYDSYWNQTLNARYASKIDRDNEGNIYLLTGRRFSTSEPEGTVTKFDENGNVLFELNESIYINKFELSSSGIYLTGTVFEPVNLGSVVLEPTSPENAFIARSNLNFDFEWGHVIDGTSSTSVASVIAVDASENVYFGGKYFGTITINNTSSIAIGGDGSLYYTKLDLEGNYQWVTYLNNTIYPKTPSQAAILNSGNFIVSAPLTQPYISIDGSSIDPDYSTTSLFLVFDENNGAVIKETTNDIETNTIRNNGFGNVLTAGNRSGNLSIGKLNTNIEDDWNLKSNGESGSIYGWRSKRVFIDADANNYCVTRYSNNLIIEDIEESSSDESIAIIKTDVNGNPIWINSIESSIFINPEDTKISPDKSNIVICGTYRGTVETNFGIFSSPTIKNFIAKFDTNTGDVLLFKSLNIEVYEIAIGQNNAIVATGSFSETANIDGVTLSSNGNQDYYIAKFNSLGVLFWAKSFGGEDFEHSPRIDLDGLENIYLSTRSHSSNIAFGNNINLPIDDIGGNRILVKYNPIGTPIWAINYGGSNDPIPNSQRFITDLHVTHSGNIFILASMDFDNNFGSIQLVSPFYDPDNPGPYRNNYFLAKINTDGIFTQANMIHVESFFSSASQIATDETGNIYIAARLRSDAYFSDDAYFEYLSDQSIGIIAKYDSLCQVSWVKSIGGDGNRPAGIAVFAEDQITFSGEFYFPQDMAGNTFNTVNSNNGYLASTTDNTTNINLKPTNSFQLNTDPNPFTNQFVLRYELEKETKVRIRIFDLQGRLVKRIKLGSRNVGTHQESINTKELSTGIYFINAITDEQSGVVKVEKIR